MIEKVLVGENRIVRSRGYCTCGCSCPYGDIKRAVDRGEAAADWDYAG